MAPRPRRNLGFTTIELIVVMVVMGILSAVAMPRLTDRSALQERGVQDQLRGMLIHSRRLAVTQGRDVCVLLAPSQASVVYVVANVCAAAQPVADPAGGAAWTVAMPTGVFLGGAAFVRFNPRGQLVPAVDSVINVGSNSITVYRETGFPL